MDDKQQQKELENFLKKSRSKSLEFERTMFFGMMVLVRHWKKKYKQSLFLYPVFYFLGFITHYVLNLLNHP